MSSRVEQLAQVASERGHLMRQIYECGACELSQSSKPTVFTGPAPAPYMLLGEMPGAYEAKSGRAWSGSIQDWLVETFKQAGLPSPNEWFLTNAFMCHSSDRDSALMSAAVTACSPLLRRQVALCDPQWVLVMGGMALRTTGTKATLGSIHGHPFLVPAGPFKDRWIFPTYSPFATSHAEKLGPVIAADLTILRDLIRGTQNPETLSLIVGRGGKLLPRA